MYDFIIIIKMIQLFIGILPSSPGSVIFFKTCNGPNTPL